MPKYGSAQQAPDPPWQPFNAPSPSYQLSEGATRPRLPQSWRYIQNKRSVCVRLKWALACQSAGLREGVLGEMLCSTVFLSIRPQNGSSFCCHSASDGGTDISQNINKQRMMLIITRQYREGKQPLQKLLQQRHSLQVCLSSTTATFIFIVFIWQMHLSKVGYTAFKFY